MSGQNNLEHLAQETQTQLSEIWDKLGVESAEREEFLAGVHTEVEQIFQRSVESQRQRQEEAEAENEKKIESIRNLAETMSISPEIVRFAEFAPCLTATRIEQQWNGTWTLIQVEWDWLSSLNWLIVQPSVEGATVLAFGEQLEQRLADVEKVRRGLPRHPPYPRNIPGETLRYNISLWDTRRADSRRATVYLEPTPS